jgi:hypothetical protein
MCSLHGTTCFDLAKGIQQFAGGYCSNRAATDVRTQILFSQSSLTLDRARRELLGSHRQMLGGDGFKRIGGALQCCNLLSLALLARIDALCQQLTPRRMTFTGGGQAHIGIGPQRKRIALSGHWTAVIPAPPLGTIGAQKQVQTATITELLDSGGRFGLANRGIGQWHEDGNWQ